MHLMAADHTSPIPAWETGAYRSVKREAARDRLLNGVPEEKKADLIPAGWFDTWADAAFASDPVGAAQTPPVLRAPNGVLVDELTYYSAGKPLYDPSKIACQRCLRSQNGIETPRLTWLRPSSRC